MARLRILNLFLTPDTTLIGGLVAQRTTLDAMLRDRGLAVDASDRHNRFCSSEPSKGASDISSTR